MSKAEQRARQAYPYEGGGKGLICEASIPIFIQGYEAAQKDLEPIRTHLHSIVEAAKRIQSLDGKDADVCDAVQDILVAAKSIEWTMTE